MLWTVAGSPLPTQLVLRVPSSDLGVQEEGDTQPGWCHILTPDTPHPSMNCPRVGTDSGSGMDRGWLVAFLTAEAWVWKGQCQDLLPKTW